MSGHARISSRRTCRALFLVGLFAVQLAHGQVALNFSNASINDVAKAIGAATGTTIIVDPRVKGQLSLVADGTVSRDHAIKTLEAALRMQGFTLVRDHGILKVVPEADAKLQGVPTYVGNEAHATGDTVVTQVVRLRNESSTALARVLKPRIVVGSNVPVQTGSFATATAVSGNGVSAFNTFDRQDVGIVLHVKPQIAQSGSIKLQIYSEDSSVDPNSTNNPGGVTIIKRSVQSTVLSDDGEIIVLGGLIQDQYADGNNKVPLLGDIPWIGQLFRAENKARTKTNVMVFMRPVVIRDSRTASDISLNRYDYVRQQTTGYQSDNRIERDHDSPALPPPGPSPSQGVPAQDGMFDLNRMTRPVPRAPAGAAQPVDPSPAAAGVTGTQQP